MRARFISDYNDGDRITDFFIVKKAEKSKKKNGDPYVRFSLADKKSEIEAVKWEMTEEDEKLIDGDIIGSVVKVRGNVSSYHDKPQITIELLRAPREGDDFDMADLIKASPLQPEDMYRFLMDKVIAKIEDDEYRTICEMVYDDYKEKLLYWPAGKSVHHDELGGLLWHTYRMALNALNMVKVYPFINAPLLIAGVLLHDIGKIHELDADRNGVVSDYTTEGSLLGHLLRDAIIVERYAEKINMTQEKRELLQHLVASHHGIPEHGAIQRPRILEAKLLNHIDMIDMYVYVAEHSLEKVEPGEFASSFAGSSVIRELYYRSFSDDPYERAVYEILED